MLNFSSILLKSSRIFSLFLSRDWISCLICRFKSRYCDCSLFLSSLLSSRYPVRYRNTEDIFEWAFGLPGCKDRLDWLAFIRTYASVAIWS